MTGKVLLTIVFSYLVGSVSMAIILTKYVFHDDVRNHGSGNAGATNVARTFGWGPGLIVLFFDFLKCAIAMRFGGWLLGDLGTAIAGISCLIGHCYPVFFNFHGGKAVSTGLCVAMLTDWRAGLIVLGVFLVVVLSTKIVSLSSMAGALALIIASFVLSITKPLRILAFFTGAFVIFMHRTNIRRLLKGEESKFSPGKRPK